MTNDSKHTATLAAITKDSAASLTNIASSTKKMGNYTLAELATLTLAQVGPYTFQTPFTKMTNDTKH